MAMNRKLSLSFTVSRKGRKGDIGHNLRTRQGKGVGQIGVAERRDWNVYYVNPKYGKRGDNPEQIVKNFVYDKVKDDLAAYNSKILKTKNPKRVLSFDAWYYKRLKMNDGTGELKKPYEECVMTCGDMFDTAPYVYQTNEEGLPIDENGNAFSLWETDKQLVPVRDANGEPIKSEAYYVFCDFFQMAVLRFNETCPDIEIISYAIHADEYGAIHIHWNFVPLVKDADAKRGIGWKFSKTAAMENACKKLNIDYDPKVKKKKNEEDIGNATDEWTQYMRNIFIDLMKEHGLQWVPAGCKGERNESVKEFKRNNARRAQELRKQKEKNDKKEAMLNKAEAKIRKDREMLLKQKEINEARAKAIESSEALNAKLKAELKDAEANKQLYLKQVNDNYNKVIALEDIEKRLNAGQDDLIARMNEVARRETIADKNYSDAAKEKAANDKKAKELSLREIAVQNAEYDLQKKQMRNAEAAKDIQFDKWIIEKVKREHADWLKKEKQSFEVHYKKLYGELNKSL